MRFITSVLLAIVAVGAPDSTHAFTQGLALLPSYLCGPAVANFATGTIAGVDGTPKALGAVLNGLQENTLNHPEGNFYDPNVDPRLWIASYHNVNAQTKAIQFYGQPGPNKLTDPAALAALKNLTDVIPVNPQVYVIGVNKIAAAPINMAKNVTFLPNVISPNELVTLSVFSQNNDVFPVPAGLPASTQKANNKFNADSDVALDGAIIYAQTANNQRVGKFVIPAPPAGGDPSTFSVWPACGADGAGIVHNTVLSEEFILNAGAQFFLPHNFLALNPQVKQITFMGAAVTDNGFGYHQTTWTVQPLPPFTPQGTITKANLQQATSVCKKKFSPCFAACVQCHQLAAGSPNVKPMCTPNLAIGDPAKNQQTIFTSGCQVNGVTQTVVPAATPLVMDDAKIKIKAATADTTEVPDAAQLMDAFMAAMQANDTDTTTTPTCQPATGSINSASSIAATTLVTTLVTFGSLFASRQ